MNTMIFFVDITFYTPKNNQEIMLHEKFKKWDHKTIDDDWKEKIKDVILEVFKGYKRADGRSGIIKYDINTCEYPNIIYIKIGKSICMNLLLIKGEL